MISIQNTLTELTTVECPVCGIDSPDLEGFTHHWFWYHGLGQMRCACGKIFPVSKFGHHYGLFRYHLLKQVDDWQEHILQYLLLDKIGRIGSDKV